MANENLRFRCSDLGHKECPWETTARNEQELMRNVEQHGREKHNLKEWNDDVRNRVRTAVKRVA